MKSFDNISTRSHSSIITIKSWQTVENLAQSRWEKITRKSITKQLLWFFLLLVAYLILWACFYRDVQAQRKDWEFLRYKIICNTINDSFHCKLVQ